MWLGPGAKGDSWIEPLCKYNSRISEIRQRPEGMMSAIVRYNVFAFSTLTYIAQLRKPNDAVIKAERHAISCLASAPHNAFGGTAPYFMRLLGVKQQFYSIRAYSFAARLRVALTHVDLLIDLSGRLKNLGPGHNFSFDLNPGFNEGAIYWDIIDAVRAIEIDIRDRSRFVSLLRASLATVTPSNLQRTIYRVAIDVFYRFDAKEYVQTRLGRWYKRLGLNKCDYDFGTLARFFTQVTVERLKKHAPCAVSAYVNFLVNGWPSPNRFGEPVKCPMCKHGELSIQHLLRCKHVMRKLRDSFNATNECLFECVFGFVESSDPFDIYVFHLYALCRYMACLAAAHRGAASDDHSLSVSCSAAGLFSVHPKVARSRFRMCYNEAIKYLRMNGYGNRRYVWPQYIHACTSPEVCNPSKRSSKGARANDQNELLQSYELLVSRRDLPYKATCVKENPRPNYVTTSRNKGPRCVSSTEKRD